jgi:hypothetical protein
MVAAAACLSRLALSPFGLRGSYEPGEIYSIADEKGYLVAKVLAVDARAVHVRVYKNKYPTRPLEIDESTLTLGTIHDPDGFGMGHLPLLREVFRKWQPVFITQASVADEELEGYELWKEKGGGLWGTPE